MHPATELTPRATDPVAVGKRIVCVMASSEEALFAAAAARLGAETFSVLALLWPRTLQRALDTAWRSGDGAPVNAQLPACSQELVAMLLARRAEKQPAPRFVCLDLDASLKPDARNVQRLRRLHAALLSGERALVLLGGSEDEDNFLTLLCAQEGTGAVETVRV